MQYYKKVKLGLFSTLDTRRIEALEVWIWCKMMKISWADKKSNKEMLNIVQEPRQIIQMMETRRIKSFWTHYETRHVYYKYYGGKR